MAVSGSCVLVQICNSLLPDALPPATQDPSLNYICVKRVTDALGIQQVRSDPSITWRCIGKAVEIFCKNMCVPPSISRSYEKSASYLPPCILRMKRDTMDYLDDSRRH